MVESACRLGDIGYVTFHSGNLSYKVSDDHIIITQTKIVKRKMTFDDIVIITIKGDILEFW